MILVLLDAQFAGDSDFLNFTKLPILRYLYLGIDNVLHIWHLLIEFTDSMIYDLHISLIDTTLTHRNLSTVLHHVVDMDTLMDCLDIPPSVQWKIIQHSQDEEQQRHKCIHYYLKSSPFALRGWGYLGGLLHFEGQEAALTAAKAYIRRAPGTCGCDMCMYWNVEDACDYVCTLHCHSKSMPAAMYNNYYCIYSNYPACMRKG